MAEDDDDFDYLGHDTGRGGALGAVLQMAGGGILSGTSLLAMFYETEMALAAHNLRTFQKDFVLVLLVGMPVFVAGVWLFNRGRRALRR